eukprot:GEMP01126157.1.p2 GENE.GEMP01126157.1~~GEMP01126157.1.p2  ORF type:complete len:101 (-),score=29.98 GEMP01126157.1:206-508(-)
MVEIYVPKRANAKENPAVTDPEALPKDEESLDALAKELGHKMDKLRDSNRQLAEALETEDDPDFREALEDNMKILEKMENRRLKIEEALRKFDHGMGMTL